jgi:two-component system, OmpR family, phosphate regulon sensor histidine kinase PhoR
MASRLSTLQIRITLLVIVLTCAASLGTGLAVAILSGNGTPQVIGALIAIPLVVTAAAGSAAYLLMRRLFRPLDRLSDAASRLATGDLETSIPVEGSHELRVLARTLENARHELYGITRWLTHEKAWAEYLVNAISDGIVTIDGEYRVTFMSRAAAVVLGVKRDDSRGKSLNDLLVPADIDGHITDLLPGEGEQSNVTAVRTDGRTITVSITGASLKPPIESSARTALVLRDITSENAMQQLQSYFLGNLSHELQTPLASLRTSAELLVTEHNDLSEQEHHRLHTAIYRGILRLEALIDNLLASASVQAGRFKVKPVSVDLGEPIEEAMLFMGPLMDAASIQLEIDLPVEVPLVCADSRRVTQVFVNLLSNVIKYTPAGTSVQLTTTLQGDECLRVNLADNGPGIAAEARDLIFSRFGRLDTAGARKDHGAGLGLYIAKTIIESHNGAIGVEPRPGGGTIFWFTLPLAENANLGTKTVS